MNTTPAPKPVIVSRKGRFHAAKALGETMRRAAHRVWLRKTEGKGTVVHDPSDVPGKAHRCICGSGRRYARCCKRALVETIRVYAATPEGERSIVAFPLLVTLGKWQAEQGKPKYLRAGR